ncbi:MAG: phosphoglycerate mutase, partial [Thermoanaerobaculia bacterium]|nr:phosphoglycerate mutase [Thermoanaerobaculia bacterium]
GPGMTANLDSDLEAKLAAAQHELKGRDLVVVHVKGADIAAHDMRPDLKVEFLERLDREVGRLLAGADPPRRVAVAADHATLSELGHHGADPVPVLLWGEGIEADTVESFDELAVARGRLRRFQLRELMGRVFGPEP